MNRNLCLGLVILSLVVALGTGSYVLDKKAAVQAAGVQAPMFEVDPMWPKPLPNHWVIGMTIGVSVGCAGQHLDHSSRRLARSQGILRQHESAGRGLLRARAAGSRIRQGRQPDRTLGRPRQGLRLAELEPRNHGRLQRQRVDRRERPHVDPKLQEPAPAPRRRRASRAPMPTIRS